MLLWLVILFIVVPLTELAILVWVGQHIGFLPTIALVLLIALLGASLVKQEGVRALLRIRDAMGRGIMPGAELVDGLLILVAGALLLTPGLLTDFFGFLLLVPPVRRLVRAAVIRYFRSRLVVWHSPKPAEPIDVEWREVKQAGPER